MRIRDGLPCIWGLEMAKEPHSELPFSERQWSELTLRALKDLGGESQMVVGAKLRQRMVELGRREDLDVAAYVSGSGHSFSGLLDVVAGVVVRRRPGSDVLVSTADAKEPEWQSVSPVRRGALRGDVYQAFTRVVQIPFVYSPETDRFLSEEIAEGRMIGVPEVTVDALIQDRQQFVETLEGEVQGPLLDALRRSPNPLAAFRQAVEGLGILDKWGSEQAKIVWSRVESWAAQNSVTPRASWFRPRRSADSAHHTLSRIAPYLTANEIRQLQIPFRAVEALLSDRDPR